LALVLGLEQVQPLASEQVLALALVLAL